MHRHPVTFYLPGERDLERLRRLDPDRDWDEFVRGEHAWILQTYLRLRRAGHEIVGMDPAKPEAEAHSLEELVPRRGSRIERIEFKGFLANLEPAFRHSDWAQWLAQRDVRWTIDAVEWKQLGWASEQLAWNDFRETDLLLAAVCAQRRKVVGL